jgi:hypothetical protein
MAAIQNALLMPAMILKYFFTSLLFTFFSTAFLTAQNFTSSNLPIVVINTNGGTILDDPKIMADMGIIYNGAGMRNNTTDPFNHFSGKVGIEFRGKSSQQFPMKSFAVELWDAAGASVNKSLLGMPSESDWILYAPYTDKTLMRNMLTYALSNEMGHWASHTRYVEVLLNNNYIGVYVLMEKIKRGSGRVDIPKLKPTDISGDALTGGYIFKIDKADPGEDGWNSKLLPNHPGNTQQIRFLYEYPKTADIVQPQKTYLHDYVDSFETALNSTSFSDTAIGFRKFADVNSFIDYFISNELSRNVDGYRLSSYFYKDKKTKGGKIIAGPVWDYDLGYRNANYCEGSTISGWSYQFNNVCNNDAWLVPFWWERFMQDQRFKASLYCRWKQLRQTSLSNQHINFIIDSVNNLLAEAQQRHFQRWPILGQYIWPNMQPIPASYAEEITMLKQWLAGRIDWIDNNINPTGPCYNWPADAKGSMLIKLYPNPFKNELHLQLRSQKDQSIILRITNGMGQVVYKTMLPLLTGSNDISNLPFSTWSSGWYHFYFSNQEGEKITEKIIKL